MSKKDLGCFYTLSHPFVRFRRLYLLSYAFICFHKLLYDFICFHTLLYPFQHFQIHFYTLLHAFIHFLYAFLRIQTQKSKTSPPPRNVVTTQGNLRLSRCAAGKNNIRIKQCSKPVLTTYPGRNLVTQGRNPGTKGPNLAYSRVHTKVPRDRT